MAKKQKTILVVDDEKNVRLLISRTLDTDYTVIEAEDGDVAIKMAQRHKPDLILMDIMMPKMDGYTTCRIIKTTPELKAIPVVMLTAVAHGLNVELSHDMGADGHMSKPFTQQDLLDMVHRFSKGRK